MTHLTLALTLLFTSLAHAQECGDRAAIIGDLSGKWGESVNGMGLAGNLIVEHWVNDTTGSWTFTTTSASGYTCITATGRGWRVVAQGDPA